MARPTELIGRTVERDRLRLLLRQDQHAVVLAGEPGVGKTALLDDLAAEARSQGWQTLQFLCVESERQFPFACMHHVVGALSAETSALTSHQRAALDAAVGRTDGSPPGVPAVGTALLDLVHAAGARRPLLLIVDDAHWMDAASAATVAFAARRLRGPTVIVAAVRTDEPTPFDITGMHHLEVSALDAVSAAELLDSLHPALSVRQRDDVLAQAGGNPLALVELPRILTAPHARLSPSALPLPRRLERVFARRLARLPRDEFAQLTLMALDGVGGTLDGGGYQPSRVDRAVAAGLLTVEPATGLVRFRHPLVRSAVVHFASPTQVTSAHAQLAERHAGDALRRAHHLAAAVHEPDERVAHDIETGAASAIGRGGSAIAVDLLTRAGDLSPAPGERARRLYDAAFVAGQAGLLDRAESLLQHTDRLGGDLTAPPSVLMAAYLRFYRDGAVLPAHQMLAETLRRRAALLDDRMLTRFINLLLTVAMYAADEELWRETETLVEDNRRRLPAATLLYCDIWGDLPAHAEGARERVAAAFAEAGDEPWELMRLAIAAHHVDALGEHRSFVERLLRREQEQGATTNVLVLLYLTVFDHTATGRWDEAAQTANHGVELSAQHGNTLFAHLFRTIVGRVHAQRGEMAQARQIVRTVEQWARPRRVGLLLEHLEGTGLAGSLTTGAYDEAWRHAMRLASPGSFLPYVHESYRSQFDLVLAGQASGRLGEARRHAVAAAAHGSAAISPLRSMLAAASLAVTDETGQADLRFMEVLDDPVAEAYPFDLARIRLAYGMWLRRHRTPGPARDQLTRAAELFEGLGAEPWAARAAHELTLIGTRGAGSTDPLGGLTAQERLIADLAASGLSNKQIGARLYLSPRTVGTHLYRIFPKLGITSRASLRDALAAMPSADADPSARRQSPRREL